MSPSHEPFLVTPAEAARMLSISRSELYVQLRAGTIPSLKIGRLRRIPVEELRRYVAALEVRGAP